MSTKQNETVSPVTGVVAAALAWLVPGAGHLYLGRGHRAIIIFLVITLTFWAGVAMGGVLTVDYYFERWWFLAQMFTGVNGAVAWFRQDRLYKRIVQEHPEIGPLKPAAGPSVPEQQVQVDRVLAEENLAVTSPTDAVARAYSGVAGLLNLMCIFDALTLGLMGTRGEPLRRREEPA